MKKLWQKILNNNNGGNHFSIDIKKEIEDLTDNRKRLEAQNIEIEKSLQGLQRDLLAEMPGVPEAVIATQAKINENKNKVAAILNVVEDLEKKLTKALIYERDKRQSDIENETSAIDKEIAATRNELIKVFAKACSLYTDLTGRGASNFSFNYFLDHNLTELLHNCIKEIALEPISLARKREALQNESVRLNKQPAA